ncbi:MAG TPA: MFS transporter [Actinomycetales bacterium]|nr:MFS transporter [Actinomycetales bacterium]
MKDIQPDRAAAGEGTRRPPSSAKPALSGAAIVLPLALAQFIASYAATNMNVAISTIADDIGTTVIGMQTTITLFTLTMASLMIPGSKLSDIWGRKFCFLLGLGIYGTGALLAAVSQGLPLMVFGYSVLEGVGSALLIPPIYILVTVTFPDLATRAKYFGVVSAAAGLGAAAGPLIGGLITSAVSWRASFLLQVLVVAYVAFLTRRIVDPPRTAPKPAFDLLGAVLCAAGLFFVVFGILQSSTYGFFSSREDFTIGGTVIIPAGGISPVWLYVLIGLVVLAVLVWHLRRRERGGHDPLVATRLFRNRTSNLGLVTQNVQWLTMQGSFFVISVYLQQVEHYSAIQTGLALTPATIGILLASALAGRMARRRQQRTLVRGGFVIMTAGTALLLLLSRGGFSIWSLIPGLLLVGIGVGIMLTASVNVVQSAFPDSDQGEISGVSRSASNLGSSLGTALAGSVLVGASVPGQHPFALALTTLMGIGLLGLLAAMLLPRGRKPAGPVPRARTGAA